MVGQLRVGRSIQVGLVSRRDSSAAPALEACEMRQPFGSQEGFWHWGRWWSILHPLDALCCE